MERPMANYPHVALGYTQETSEIRPRFFVVKRHDDNGALSFLEELNAVSQLFLVQRRQWRLDGHRQLRGKLFEQALFSLSAAPYIDYCHTACSQHKRRQFIRFPETSRSKGLNRRDQDLLCKVVGCVLIPQVTQTVEPDPGSHSSKQFGFGITVISRSDSLYQFGVAALGLVLFNSHQFIFYV